MQQVSPHLGMQINQHLELTASASIRLVQATSWSFLGTIYLCAGSIKELIAAADGISMRKGQ